MTLSRFNRRGSDPVPDDNNTLRAICGSRSPERLMILIIDANTLCEESKILSSNTHECARGIWVIIIFMGVTH
jgi:hypothetical protein